jgi:hypothetical protein
MPKLDGTHLPERLRKRIAELEDGQELAAKDINVLLTSEQTQALNDAWAAQQVLRREKRARTADEQRALGWKSKREVRLEVLRDALRVALQGQNDAWQLKRTGANVRQTRIYFEALADARKAGKEASAAKNWANNELTRAGLRRMDRVGAQRASQRDKDVEAAEEHLRQTIRETMTEAELARLDLLPDGTKPSGRSKPPSR